MLVPFLDSCTLELDEKQESTVEESIVEIVKESLKDLKSLPETEKTVKLKFDGKLGNVDCVFIEDNYKKHLIEYWNEECFTNFHEIISTLSTTETSCEFQQLIEELSNVNSIEGVYNFFEHSPYSWLISKFFLHSKKLKQEESLIVDRLKHKCLWEVKKQFVSVKDELDLLKCFEDVLKLKDLKNTCTLLQLENFVQSEDSRVGFETLLSQISNLKLNLNDAVSISVIQKLQGVVRRNSKKKIYIFIRHLKDLIQSFLKPVEEDLKPKEDGRRVLLLNGKHQVLSQIVPKFESKPWFCQIEEVRFVGAVVIHADCDLKADFWHGKNVVLVADHLVVTKESKVEWNVSGKSATNPKREAKAGTDIDGYGMKGADGLDGESGGNVCLLVSLIENGENLTIKSLGGMGSRGQDGGEGKYGSDGKGLSETNFNSDFPPVAKLRDSFKVELLQQNLYNICKNIDVVEKFTYGSSELSCPMSKDEVSRYLIDSGFVNTGSLTNIYIEAITTEGYKITFSFCYESYSPCQAYLLHEGSEGEVGKSGGAGGFGGQRGFSGEIEIPNQERAKVTTIYHNIGEDGNLDGNPGQSGKPGKKGFDRGYMDSSLYLWSTFPKHFSSSNEDAKLTLHFQSDKSSDRVWCFMNNRYCTITKAKQTIRKLQKMQMKHNLKMTQHRREVRVQRKKSICKIEMKTKYDNRAKKLDGIQNVEAVLEEKLTELEQQIETKQNVTTSFKVVKEISFKPKSHFSSGLTEIDKKSLLKENQKVKDYVEKPTYLSQNESTFENYFKDLSKTTKILQLTSASSENNEHRKIVCLKKVKVLKEIHSYLETQPNISKAASDSVEFDTKVLSVKHKDSLTGVERLFLKDSRETRLEVIETCKSLRRNSKFSTYLFGVFIEEYESSLSDAFREAIGKEHANFIHQLHKQVIDFQINRIKAMSSKFVPLNELLKSNESILRDLFDTIAKESDSCKMELEIQLSKNKFLSAMFRQFLYESKNQFDFEKVSSEHLMEAFTKCFEKVGPFSSCYREFLANHFKTNILLYQIKQDCFELIDNHYPQARLKIPILLKEERFSLLSVDSKFNELIQQNKSLSTFYDRILLDVDSLDNLQELEEYNSKKPFKSSVFIKDADSLKVKNKTVEVKISHLLSQDEDIKMIANSFSSDEDKFLVYSRLEKLKEEFIGYDATLTRIATHFFDEGNTLSARELCYIINCILRSTLDDSNASKYAWIVASHHPMDWITEIAIVSFECSLKQILSSEVKLRWRNCLNNQKNEKDKLLFLLERISDESTLAISMECFEEILFYFESIPKAHKELDDVEMEKWKYHLKDKCFTKKIEELTDQITTCSDVQAKEITFFMTALDNKLGSKLCETTLNVFKKKADTISCEEDKLKMIRTLKTLTSCDISFCEKILSKLSSSKIVDWEVVANNVCLNKGQERSYDDLIELINRSGNTSKDILNQLQSIKDTVKAWEGRTLMVSPENSSEVTSSENTATWFLGKFEDVVKTITEFTSPQTWKDGLTCTKINEVVPNMVKMSFKRIGCSPPYEVQSTIIETLVQSIETENYQEILQKLVFNKLDSIIFVPFIAKIIELKLGKTLRNTQIITITTMLQNSNNTLAQVSTGEGKSLIVVVLSIIKALLGNKVNVITSSTVLAKRDAQAYKEVFDFCGVNVGHNCSEDLEERKKMYSSCQIVYGELGNFQRDYLLDRMYNKNIRGDCAFDVVIGDEVDSLLLDKGNNVLYLAHDIPGLDNLECIFIHIWKWLNDPKNKQGIDPITNLASLKESILFDIFGLVKKEYLNEFIDTNCKQVLTNTWNYLIKIEVIDLKGNVLVENMNQFEIKIKTIPELCLPKHHLDFIFKRVFDREKSLNIPNYLKPFVENHLDKWIQSGVNALTMQSERDYVVDVDRSETASECNPNIILLDPSTGADLPHSQWDEALHQFLQLKHGCKLSLVSLKAVFVSNVSYLKLYNTLYGLTGTLGSQQERDMLQDTYKKEDTKLDFVTIPTAKFKRFSEDLPILCSHEDWADRVSKEVCQIVKTRSVLIICESVVEVNRLKGYFPSNIVHTYTRDYEKLAVAENLEPGQVIIATNLAGRGTDIIISQALEEAGGLHVCLTYLPTNCRIEEQAYGRVARNGQPGTAQMILRVSNEFLGKGISKFINLKKQRDADEKDRLFEIQDHYRTRIQPEEFWLEKFRNMYETLRTDPLESFFESTSAVPVSNSCEVLNMKSSPVDYVSKILKDPLESLSLLEEKERFKLILMETCLNLWAFWLDKNSSLFSSGEHIDELESRFQHLSSTCEALRSADYVNCLHLIKDPYQLIKLGVYYLGKRNTLSIQLFDTVIEKEPVLSDIALYYKVCAKTMDKDLEVSDIISDLETIASKLKKKIHSAASTSYFIDWMKEDNPQNITQIRCFKQQQLNISNIFNLFLQSINDVLGHEISPEMLNLFDDNACALKLFNDLNREGVFAIPMIKSTVNEEDLKFAWKYMIPPQRMLRLLEPLKGEKFSERIIQEVFKTILPSKELFWQEMKKYKCLVDEENVIFICMQELEKVDPSLLDKLNNIADENILNSKLHNTYLYEYENQFKEGERKVKVVEESKLTELIGNDRYKFLIQSGTIITNKRARFHTSTNKNPTFSHFDSIGIEDFVGIGIEREVAREILHEMESLNILKPCNNEQYFLATHSENIERLCIPSHKPYTQVVKTLLEFCFAFRIAFEKVKLLSENVDVFPLPLKASLHKKIILDLDENNIITKTRFCKNKDVAETLSKLYSSSMPKSSYAKLFDQFGDELVSKAVVEELIQNRWLICKLPTVFNKKYSINPIVFDNENRMLNGSFENESKTIATILLNHQQLTSKFKENKQTVVKALERFRGTVYSVETPKLSLKPLLDVLKKANLPLSELSRFSLNGFDKLFTLEEKKWTWSMIMNTFVIAAFGLAQICAGVVLAVPLGPCLIAEGVNDLIFAGTCILSGHCTWISYFQHKLISLILSSAAVCSFRALNSMGTNVTSEMSFQQIKKYILEVVSHIKDTGKIDWSKFFRTRRVVSEIVKKINVHTVKTIERKVTCTTIHTQLDLLGDFVTEAIYSTVNKIIEQHEATNKVNQIHQRYDSEEICINSFRKCVENHRNELEPTFKNITELLKTTIDEVVNLQLEFKSGRALNNNLLNIVSRTKEAVKRCFEKNLYYFNFVVNVMDDVENCLHTSIQDQQFSSHQSSTANKEEQKNFQEQITEIWKGEVRELFSDQLQLKVVSPVLTYIANVLLTSSSQNSLSERSKHRKENPANRTDQIQYYYYDIEQISDTPRVCSHKNNSYNTNLLKLFKRNHSGSIFSEILRNSLEVDSYFLDIFCSSVPWLLRREGIYLPDFQLVIERNGKEQRFPKGDMRYDIPTVVIVFHTDQSTNVKNNILNIREVFEAINDQLLKSSPVSNAMSAQILQLSVINAVEIYSGNRKIFDCNSKQEIAVKEVNSINLVSEKLFPYQNFQIDGHWKYNPKVDVDLRDNKEHKVTDKIEDCILKGFKTALGKINNKIHEYLKRPFKLDLEDFFKSNHLLAPQKERLSRKGFSSYPTRYELVVPLPVCKGETRKLDKFRCLMVLENCSNSKRPFQPVGPHIKYEIEPEGIKLLKFGVKGYILLPIECKEESFSIKDCYAAGELSCSNPQVLGKRDDPTRSYFSWAVDAKKTLRDRTILVGLLMQKKLFPTTSSKGILLYPSP